MKTELLIAGVLIMLTGCAKNILIPGTYVEKCNKNVVIFVKEEYKFKSENKFEYRYWSDDLGSIKYGFGAYKLKKHQLLLEFTDELIARPKSTIVSKISSITDSAQNLYKVHVKTNAGINLAGVNILLTNFENDIITGTASDTSGMAELALSKKNIPSLLKVTFIGYEDVVVELDHNESMYFEVTLAENMGTRIINEQKEKRVKLKRKSVIIDGKEYEKVMVVSNI